MEEAVAYLVAEARRMHQEEHDASPPGCCRRCLDRQLRLAVQDARERLSPEQFKFIRWALIVELGTT